MVDVDTPAGLGGRRHARALVGWRDENGPQRVESADPTRTVLELAARFGGEVPELTVTRPSLESVYLRMIETVETEESDRTTGDRS
jgi:ABC-2 type transport system ATP-binding protein